MSKVFNGVRIREYDNGEYLAVTDCAKAVGYTSAISVRKRIDRDYLFKRPCDAVSGSLWVAAPDVIREALRDVDFGNAVAFRKWLADTYVFPLSEEAPVIAEVNDHKAVSQIDESLEMFDFGGHNVRVSLDSTGEPWFVLKDVCDVLDIRADGAKSRLMEDDTSSTGVIDRLGRSQAVTTVNESGLYDVILDSRKPEAKKFRRWVTSEVLPSIRRDGGYIKGQEDMTGEELMARALQFADSRIKSLEALVEANKGKVEFAEAVEATDEAITFTEMAKIIDSTVCPLTVQQLTKTLRDEGYLFRREVGGTTLPIRRYMEEGLFVVRETGYWSNTLNEWVPTVQTRVTGKGQLFLVDMFRDAA